MVACGATGDIFRGSYQGAEVAMKRLRVTMSDIKSRKASITNTAPFYQAEIPVEFCTRGTCMALLRTPQHPALHWN